MLPEDRLRLRAIAIQSPGFWEFLGTANPLEVLRKYINDRHERQKDSDYRNHLEAERLRLENERLKTGVVSDRIEILRNLGVSEDRIRESLTKHLVEPLAGIDIVQDSRLIEGAELVEEDLQDDEQQGLIPVSD